MAIGLDSVRGYRDQPDPPPPGKSSNSSERIPPSFCVLRVSNVFILSLLVSKVIVVYIDMAVNASLPLVGWETS